MRQIGFTAYQFCNWIVDELVSLSGMFLFISVSTILYGECCLQSAWLPVSYSAHRADFVKPVISELSSHVNTVNLIHFLSLHFA